MAPRRQRQAGEAGTLTGRTDFGRSCPKKRDSKHLLMPGLEKRPWSKGTVSDHILSFSP